MPKRNGARPADTGLEDQTPSLDDLDISKFQSHRWQAVAAVPDETFESYIATVKGSEDDLTTAGLLSRRTDAALRSSESNEWYTPAVYIEAARTVLGGIDLEDYPRPSVDDAASRTS